MGSRKPLMRNYPNGKPRQGLRPQITEHMREVSRRFDHEYFDGDRMYGYGGFTYHARFWSGVVQDFLSEYDVPLGGTVLDIGCAKGFMLVDFSLARPDLRVTGVDISAYAISHADPRVLTSLMQADAQSLPLASGSVDLAISINTLHNLAGSELVRAFGEIERVSRGNAFVMVDAFETEAEEQAMRDWVLTAKTVMHCDQWIDFFDEVGYSGDFDFWTVT